MAAHPTFVLGLGDFGAKVVSRLSAELSADAASHQEFVLAVAELQARDAQESPAEIVARVRGPRDDDEVQTDGGLALSAPLTELDRNRIAEFARKRAWELLTLNHYLEHSAPSEVLRPQMAVFVVANLGEEAVQLVLGDLIEILSRAILNRYSHIFSPAADPTSGPNFGVYPLLFLGNIRELDGSGRGRVLEAVRNLESVAAKSSSWWPTASPARCLSRVVLFDDQTAKYVLTPEQVLSSLAAFLLVAIYAAQAAATSGDPTWSLAKFLRSSDAEDGVFATFGAATLDLGRETVRRYVVNRLALALVEGARPDSPAEPLGLKLKHLYQKAELEEALGRPPGLEPGARNAAEQIQDGLERLSGDLVGRCEDVTRRDTPESILNSKYSWPWFEDLAKTFQNRCQDLDERFLPLAAEEVDRAGLDLARRHYRELEGQVDRWVWSEPTGWHRARQYLQELHGQVSRELDRLETQAKLPPVPEPKAVERAIGEVREVGGKWPRTWRVVVTGIAAVVVLTALFQFLPKWLYLRFVYENTLFVKPKPGLVEAGKRALARATGGVGVRYVPDPRAPEGMLRDTKYDPPSWLSNPMHFELPPNRMAAHFLVDRPYVLVWLALVFGLLVGFALERHRRRLEREMAEAVRRLRHRLEELVTGPRNSAREYFESRIQFSRDLWRRKLLTRLKDQTEEEIQRLNAIDDALTALRHRYRQAQKQLGVRYVGPAEDIEDLSGVGGDATDPVYRRLADPGLLVGAYERVADNETSRVFEFFAEQREPPPGSDKETADWRTSASFASGQAIDRYVARVVSDRAEDLDPLRRLLDADAREDSKERLARAVGGFFGDLTGKLSHSVEMVAPPMEGLTKLILVPQDLLERLEGEFEELLTGQGGPAALLADVERIPSPDRDRLTLFVGYAGLKLQRFRLLSFPGPVPKKGGASKEPTSSRTQGGSGT